MAVRRAVSGHGGPHKRGVAPCGTSSGSQSLRGGTPGAGPRTRRVRAETCPARRCLTLLPTPPGQRRPGARNPGRRAQPPRGVRRRRPGHHLGSPAHPAGQTRSGGGDGPSPRPGDRRRDGHGPAPRTSRMAGGRDPLLRPGGPFARAPDRSGLRARPSPAPPLGTPVATFAPHARVTATAGQSDRDAPLLLAPTQPRAARAGLTDPRSLGPPVPARGGDCLDLRRLPHHGPIRMGRTAEGERGRRVRLSRPSGRRPYRRSTMPAPGGAPPHRESVARPSTGPSSDRPAAPTHLRSPHLIALTRPGTASRLPPTDRTIPPTAAKAHPHS